MSDKNINPLELSDEDFLNTPLSVFENTNEETVEQSDDIEDKEEIENKEVTNSTDTNNDVTEEEEEDNENLNDDTSQAQNNAPDEDIHENSDNDTTLEKNGQEEPENQDNDTTSTEDTDNEAEKVDIGIDYEAEYKKIFAPFKANGRMVQLDNADQAIQLMQMGAGYNEKMSKLKPSLRILKMLENNQLLDEAKLNYLIDLDKKNPDAINKLIKESGIDPLDVDVEKENTYKPNNYNVNEKAFEVDMVLKDIEGTGSFSRTIDIIGNKWDDESKKALYDNPENIRFINEQVSNGIFDQINNIIQNQRMLGNLKGVSDIEAYHKIGAYMTEHKLFNGQNTQGQNSGQNKSVNNSGVPANTSDKNQISKLNDRRKAAGSTSSTSKTSTPANNKINPLEMSDEEFEKLGIR